MLWAAVHAFVAVVTNAEVVVFAIPTSLALVVIAGAIGLVDNRRRRELSMLGNLGVSPVVPAGLWAATVLVLEFALFALGPAAIGRGA